MASIKERKRRNGSVYLAEIAKASRIVLGGFELKSEANVIRFPNRFEDSERGVEFWEEVDSILNEIRANELSFKNEPQALQN